MSLPERIHGRYVHGRRVERLARHLAPLFAGSRRVLDVGCGDGWLSRQIQTRLPDAEISGLELLPREGSLIPVAAFDGQTLPQADGSVDIVMMVDVLHHTEDPLILLREAARVARRAVILKDHLREGVLAGPTLRFMDRVSNTRHGVPLPHNYWTRDQWRRGFESAGLRVDTWFDKLNLYPGPADWIFGRGLHFIARLVPAS